MGEQIKAVRELRKTRKTLDELASTEPHGSDIFANLKAEFLCGLVTLNNDERADFLMRMCDDMVEEMLFDAKRDCN
jgi:S-adenosylmethionine hydrolase